MHCDAFLLAAGFLKATITPGTAPFFEPLDASEGWWNGLSKVTERVMSTVGEVECLRDPIVAFNENVLEVQIGDAQMVVEENGVHIDMLVDFGCGQGGRSKSYEAVMDWLVESFAP